MTKRRCVNSSRIISRPGVQRAATAADGSEALKVAAEHPLDLLLLDIGLPGPDGLAVLQAVRREMQVPVLMISARGREVDRVKALDLGADDYLTKPFGVAELLARVRALLRRVTPGPRGPLPPYRYQGLEVDFGARRARLNGGDVPLTRREFEVLAYLAKNPGKSSCIGRCCRPCGEPSTGTRRTTSGPSCSASAARLNPTATIPDTSSRKPVLGTGCFGY